MPSETTDIMRPVKDQSQDHHQLTDPASAAALAPAPITMQPPKPTDMLPCPRCGSGSTKFCYYNNYNLSQPRYFCKGCRRYWTQGGTLRCVPVGGGTRKNASSSSSASKRSRSSSASSTSTNSSTSNTSNTSTGQEPVPVSASGSELHHPELIKAESNNSTTTPYGLNLNEKFEPVITTDSTGNFMSLLNCQDPPMLGMSGYGSGFGYGFYDMGLAFNSRVGTNIWSYPGIPTGSVTDGAAGVAGGDANPGCNTWQVGHDVGGGGGNGGAGGGVVDDGGDYFSWPGLAISTPGKTFK